MRKVQIITDSCADLNPEQLQKYGIAFAKMSTSCDGVESVASLTWTESEAHEHYNKMRDGKRIHTAQVSSAEFGRIFEEYLKRDMDIVYIGCSSKQSGSVNTGIFCMLGHAFPIQYGFKGGKGFLVCLSTVYVIDWRVGLIATGIMVALLLTTKYMSLSTTVAMLLCPILLIPFGVSVPVIPMAAACALFMAVRHKENFKRLVKGTETGFSLKGKKKNG